MAPSDSNAKPGTYLFEVPGKPVSIYLSLDVVDRLQQDVMRGFGAVPKRGAEIGGVLLGSATREPDRLVVNVDEYEMIPIEYKRGPSYLFSQPDREAFAEALARLRTAAASVDAPGPAPIGFFRSNTRDAVGVQAEDLELLDQFFPDPNAIVLMIKPFASRAGMATFLVRENGKFPEGAPELEFAFRRKDLAPADDPGPKPSRGSDTPVTRVAAAPVADRGEPVRPPRSEISIVPYEPPRYDEPERIPSVGPAPARVAAPSPPLAKARGGWVWVPLSFIFLLLGVLLGFQAALTMRPQTASGGADPFNLSLTVSKEGEDLNVRWDRQSPAIRAARRGVLIIVDGTYNKTVELDANQLQTGSVVYRYNSGDVRFRLEVYPRDRDVLIESLDWGK